MPRSKKRSRFNKLAPVQAKIFEAVARQAAGKEFRKKVPSSSNVVGKVATAIAKAVFNPWRGGHEDKDGNIVPSPAQMAGYLGPHGFPFRFAEVQSELASRNKNRPRRPFADRPSGLPSQPRLIREGDRFVRDGAYPRRFRPDPLDPVQLAPRDEPPPLEAAPLPAAPVEREAHRGVYGQGDREPVVRGEAVPPRGVSPPRPSQHPLQDRIDEEARRVDEPLQPRIEYQDRPRIGFDEDVEHFQYDDDDDLLNPPPARGIEIEEGEHMVDDDPFPNDDEQAQINAEIARDANMHDFDEEQAQLDAELDALEEQDNADRMRQDMEDEMNMEAIRDAANAVPNDVLREFADMNDHDDPFAEEMRRRRVPSSLNKVYLELNDAAPQPHPSYFDLSPDTVINPNKYAKDFPIVGPVLIGEERLNVNIKRRSDFTFLFPYSLHVSLVNVGGQIRCSWRSCYSNFVVADTTRVSLGSDWEDPLRMIGDLIWQARSDTTFVTEAQTFGNYWLRLLIADPRLLNMDNACALTYVPLGSGVSQRLGRVVAGNYISVKLNMFPAVRIPEQTRESANVFMQGLSTMNPSAVFTDTNVNPFKAASESLEFTTHRVIIVLSTIRHPEFSDIVVDARDIHSPVSLHMRGSMEVLRDVTFSSVSPLYETLNIQLKEREFFFSDGDEVSLRGSHVFLVYASACLGVPIVRPISEFSFVPVDCYRPPKCRYSYTFGYIDA